jgi:hypothetical protein
MLSAIEKLEFELALWVDNAHTISWDSDARTEN